MTTQRYQGPETIRLERRLWGLYRDMARPWFRPSPARFETLVSRLGEIKEESGGTWLESHADWQLGLLRDLRRRRMWDDLLIVACGAATIVLALFNPVADIGPAAAVLPVVVYAAYFVREYRARARRAAWGLGELERSRPADPHRGGAR